MSAPAYKRASTPPEQYQQQYQQQNQQQQQYQNQQQCQQPIHLGPNNQPYMLVVDPVSRKLCIPLESIAETLARYRQGVPSLCMLFFSNRCRQGVHCHQVHADPSVVQSLRTNAQKTLMCCKTHGDKAYMPPYYQSKYVLLFGGGSGNALPIEKLAMTHGLQRYVDEYEQNNPADAKNPEKIRLCPSATTICRLHGQDRCRFGDECKFLHLCKELLWSEVSAAGMTQPGPPRGRFQNSMNNSMNDAPPSPYHSNGMPPSPTMGHAPYSSGRGYYQSPPQMSTESLISMDLTATPPMTPTSNPMDSPVIKCKQAGDSWNYEPYGFNPIPMMPPALDSFE